MDANGKEAEAARELVGDDVRSLKKAAGESR